VIRQQGNALKQRIRVRHTRQATRAESPERSGDVHRRPEAAFFLHMPDPGEIDPRGRVVHLHQRLHDRDGRLAALVEFGGIAHQALECVHQIGCQAGHFQALDCRRGRSHHVIALVLQKRRKVTNRIMALRRLANGMNRRQRGFSRGRFGHRTNIELKQATMLALQNPPRKRWTRAECERLEETGVLDTERFELIDGELIDKMSKNPPHVDIAALLLGWLIQVFGARFVNHEAPIGVAPEDSPTNEPIPDLIVLKRNFAGFRSARPQPNDLDLVVEIADTSLAFDLSVKAALYARAGIVEYWVLDVLGRRLIVHRDPQAGQYGSVTTHSEQEGVAPLAVPDSTFQIRSVFPE
jgi:Uma2 family endonuclease